MKIEERSYKGKVFRPRPEIHIEADGELSIIATPWGARSGAKRVIEIIQDFILSARQDREVTSPFQKITCLSALGNNLRVAVMLANDVLYREENRQEYTSGVEVFIVARSENEIVWAQVGHPQVFLSRKGHPLIPLGCSLDLSSNLGNGQDVLAPLPQSVLGLETTSNFSVYNMKPQKDDRLILLSRSHCPIEFLNTDHGNLDLDKMSRTLADANPEAPYWLGLLDVDPS